MKMLCRWIRRHALDVEGIFRKPGNGRQVRAWIAKLNADPTLELPPDEMCENAASLVVKFLMGLKGEDGLPAKIWGPESSAQAVQFSREVRTMVKECGGDYDRIPIEVNRLLKTLPRENQATLKEIAGMLNEACQPEHTETNLMDAYKFGLCVTPAIQWFMQQMIENYDEVFADLP
eukprot:TRINITY_DN11410_c0_g1_i2.p1 TRINITY_DN11410_c0_g1~~TRINITY_DN11410_c0_g1_i2.p1  ORF type:complete len:176 (-),score=36.74 TRINITY_DN11410_c0_g1_i2:312-839(-)